MAGEGQMLRAAREDKKWSLTDTEETTKISVRYIQALEEENYQVLPGITYVKGYLRTYAKQLGLNPDEIIALYKASITSEIVPMIEPSQMLKKSGTVWLRSAIIGIIAVLAMGVVIAIANLGPNGQNTADSLYVPAPLPSAPKIEVATPSPSIPKTEETTSSASAPEPQSTQSNVEVATTEGLTAQLVFTQPCWVVVKVDGQPSFQATYEAGTSKEVKGTQKIELVSVGNAGGLSVTLNGKAYPDLGNAGQVVRNVIFTPDTLKSL